MAKGEAGQNLLTNRLKALSDGDALMGVGMVAILSVMLLPLPSSFLDVLLIINISVGLIILLTAIYSYKPLDFMVFPSLLLVTTLFRIALAVASARLVLLHGHEGTKAAGLVIHAFGTFVVGGNYVVGFVLFGILVIVNFMVITKGTERISEVVARFTLDAMPGKQMSIDADLNTGMIDEGEARRRRQQIRQEADFYGTMDGAAKFVRGDAIACILITFVNIFGGLAIGVLQNGMPISDAFHVYTLLTVGDGLVAQIPALIISSSAGILVSRAAAEMGMGAAFGKQFSVHPRPLSITGAMLYFLSIVPSFPAMPLILVGTVMFVLAGYVARKPKREQGKQKMEEADGTKPQKGSDLPPLLDILELELGYGLIPLVDESQSGDLLPRIKAIRQQLALEYGILVPALHVRDNLQLKPAEYRLLLKGNPVGKGEIMVGHFLALSAGESSIEIKGIPTRDPAFDLPAVWIPESRREEATRAGYTVIDPSSVVATHMTELFKKYADQMLTRQTVQQLLDNLALQQPKLVDELIPNLLSPGVIQKVLQNLIREGVTVRDLQSICETLADYGAVTKDPDILTEYVRQVLARTITRPYETEDQKFPVLSLQQSLEEKLTRGIQKSEHGSFLSLDPGFLQQFLQALSDEVKRSVSLGYHPVLLCSPAIRRHLRKLLERFLPDVAVISHNELSNSLEIRSIGIIRMEHAG
ncbi:MAG TPA: flagellar biosynthesis protein FlhA [Deltaproteobacteria bacterium]|nr:flagellar biosynthesis protein FlhA [Deltaproteobacteria bacterium]